MTNSETRFLALTTLVTQYSFFEKHDYKSRFIMNNLDTF